MKKRVLAVALLALMLLTLVAGCGKRGTYTLKTIKGDGVEMTLKYTDRDAKCTLKLMKDDEFELEDGTGMWFGSEVLTGDYEIDGKEITLSYKTTFGKLKLTGTISGNKITLEEDDTELIFQK